LGKIVGFSSTLRYGPVNDELRKLLTANGHELVEGPRYDGVPTEDEVSEMIGDLLPDADAILLGGALFTARHIATAPNLKAVSRIGVGYDAVDLEGMAAANIPVTITIHANAETVADFAVTLMLALTRQLLPNHLDLSSGTWTRTVGNDFFGKTVGIAGLGRIGRGVAIRAKAFGMNVIAHELYPDSTFVEEHDIRLVDLNTLCTESDFVSLHMPGTAQTRQCINAERLSLMKPTAYLVNTARGVLIDESALLHALNNGVIAGAGLDVFDVEPISNSPFFGLQNTIVTPHIAGITEEANLRMVLDSAKNAMAVLSGSWPRNIVVNKVFSD
jgi:phosphoglycerate dehydrogenase-like enzyme